MRPIIDDLLAIAYRYYPRGVTEADSGFYDTQERERLIAARRYAGTEDRFERWRHMIYRLEGRFPDCYVMDRSLHLASGTWDACYSGWLTMPPRPGEDQRHIGFLVSFLVPYYVVYTSRVTFLDMNDPAHQEDWMQQKIAFTFAPDEESYARAFIAEIDATYPDHEPMPHEVGQLIVPQVVTSLRPIDTATLFDCLFSDEW
jgi:hypothetical protein